MIFNNPQRDETTVTTQAKNLSARQNLSLVLGFKKGTFAVDIAVQRRKKLQQIGNVAMLTLPTILIGFVMYAAWRKNGKDAKGRGTIVPEYMPPTGLNSLTSDFILCEELNNKAITALIIELAIRKYLSISEIRTKALLATKTDYTLTVLKPLEGLTTEELSVMKLYTLSPNTVVGTQVSLSALAGVTQIELQQLTKNLPQALVDQGYFKANPTKIVNKYRALGSMGLILAFVGFVWLRVDSYGLGWLAAGIALASLVTIIFARLLAARTDKGAAAKDYLRGLKMYMSLPKPTGSATCKAPKV